MQSENNSQQKNIILDKTRIALYEQYIENAKALQPLKQEIDQLKDEKYKQDSIDAKVHFGLWLGWAISILTSIVLRVVGFADISLIVNIGAISFLVPTAISKVLKFPKKKKYIEKKRALREQINALEDENKKIAENLLEIKNYQNQLNCENQNFLQNETQKVVSKKESVNYLNKIYEVLKRSKAKPQNENESENEL